MHTGCEIYMAARYRDGGAPELPSSLSALDLPNYNEPPQLCSTGTATMCRCCCFS
jgi:hypothetical protein|eukprot:SAG25_NODE_830_length_5160_cov_1179.194626_6_plen_55_part_00